MENKPPRYDEYLKMYMEMVSFAMENIGLMITQQGEPAEF